MLLHTRRIRCPRRKRYGYRPGRGNPAMAGTARPITRRAGVPGRRLREGHHQHWYDQQDESDNRPKETHTFHLLLSFRCLCSVSGRSRGHTNIRRAGMGFPSAEPCRAPRRNASTRDSARAEACYVDWRLICRTYMELGARLFLRPGTTNSEQVQVLSRQLHEPRNLGLGLFSVEYPGSTVRYSLETTDVSQGTFRRATSITPSTTWVGAPL